MTELNPDAPLPPDDAPSPAENGGEVAELLRRCEAVIAERKAAVQAFASDMDANRERLQQATLAEGLHAEAYFRNLVELLREAAGVREELQRVYELVHFHGKASREAQQRAESAEKRLADVDGQLQAERENIAALGRSHDAERGRRLAAERRLAEADACVDKIRSAIVSPAPVGQTLADICQALNDRPAAKDPTE